ncbi:MAG: von Willebrand factor type A domain-containing protein [Rhizobiaceae bacterium]
MEDRLNSLGKKATPEPRAQAREAALAAAMAAFDAAGEQKNAVPTQGLGLVHRLISNATSHWRQVMMKNRLATSTALATLLILPIGGYVSWNLLQENAAVREFGPVVSGGATKKDEVQAIGEAASRTDEEDARQQTQQEVAVLAAPEPQAVPPSPVAESKVRGLLLDALRPEKKLMSRSAAVRDQPVASADGYVMPRPVPPASEPSESREERDRLEKFDTNPLKIVSEEPVSTFSADVDTASYSLVRRSLNEGRLPEPQSVRVEEMVNYFPYDWAGPESADTPFKANVTLMPTPWNADTQLLHISVKGYDLVPATRPRANLVFLLDVSGSMDAPDKLPLLKAAFRLLVDRLNPNDTVSIVTYAGNAGTVLEPTRASDKATILTAMDRLQPGGSTAGASGIEEAYRLAEKAFVKEGVNRVMLATDGDFNVGASDDESLKRMIEAKRKSGVFLSVFGFGQGNYNDQLMQVLAQNGNGVAAYIDTLAEAEKTLVQEAASSLFPIASDVKFQIEFNPAKVAEYRQIGFETRALDREDFNNDRVDAGDIGSGHTVTAIYEIVPVGSPAVSVSALRYGEDKPAQAASSSDEIAFLKMRAKKPGESRSELTEIAVTPQNGVDELSSAPQDVRFSVAVAAFGQKLRGTSAVDDYSYEAIGKLAAGARGDDPYGYRSEFLKLVRLARGLSGSN